MDSSVNGFGRKFVSLRTVKHALGLLLIGAGSPIVLTPALGQVGDLPVPVLQGVQVQPEASFDPGAQLYTYKYTVTNPGTNTGEIWHLGLDVRNEIPTGLDSSGLTIPIGTGRFKTFDQELRNL